MKDRTVCKNRYNKKRRKNNSNTLIQNQQPEFDNNKDNGNNPSVSVCENHRHVVMGPSDVGKTYYILKILEKIGNKRPIHIITRSSNQYPNYHTSKEIKPIGKNKGSVVTFDDMLGARNSSQLDELYTRGKNENLDFYYINQTYFALPRQNNRNNSDRITLFKQTLGDV